MDLNNVSGQIIAHVIVKSDGISYVDVANMGDLTIVNLQVRQLDLLSARWFVGFRLAVRLWRLAGFLSGLRGRCTRRRSARRWGRFGLLPDTGKVPLALRISHQLDLRLLQL